MIYCISGFDPISDELVESFTIPEELTARCLEIVGNQYDGVNDYSVSRLTLDSLRHCIARFGFKINPDLDYSIGPLN